MTRQHVSGLAAARQPWGEARQLRARGTASAASPSARLAGSPRQVAQRQHIAASFGAGVVQRALMPGVGDADYQREAGKNLLLEAELGSHLSASGQVQGYAASIRLYSGAPSNWAAMTAEDRAELGHLVGPIGGARDLREDRNTLDANVLATHLKIDRQVNRDPNAPDPNRRQNRYNRVASNQNPIFPWNIHDFDMALHEIARWEDYPAEMAELIEHRWDEYRVDDTKYAQALSLPSLIEQVGLAGMGARQVVALLTPAERKTFLYDILDVKWSTVETTADEVADQTPRDNNPLGPQKRQHNTGNKANVVRAFDAQDPKVAQWVAGALLNNKPIVSGPSGHTLRFLNHWAEVRLAYRAMQGFFWALGVPMDVSRLPSLVEARFVMMANLMPPKEHHSYHEIMGASIGIADDRQTLAYAHPNSYADLNIHPVGQAALRAATEVMSRPNVKPLPNPWAGKPAPAVQGWPPASAEDLAGFLYRYGASAELVETMLQGAGSRLRIGVIPLVEQARAAGRISAQQSEFVLDKIREMG